jgi:DNA repair protein SbcD/Mre11
MRAIKIISTDWHIKPDNVDEIYDLVVQKVHLANELKVNDLVCLGDVFQSRQAQPLLSLKCFEKCLDYCYNNKKTLYCIAGNHDKTDYQSQDSFIDQFSWHPALKLMRSHKEIEDDGVVYHYLPFFEDEMWGSFIDLLSKNIDKSKNNVLFSHQAITGSRNNDGSLVENLISIQDLDMFDKVFLGHYHNKQQLSNKVFHLPSIKCNNFGEDNDKGFTVLYEDLSFELITSKFKEYHTIDIDLNELDKSKLDEITSDAKELIESTGTNIRFNVFGSEDKVKSLNKEDFEGIVIKKRHTQVVESINKAKNEDMVIYDDKKILERFEEFCLKEGYNDIDYGRSILMKKLR